MSTSYSPTIGQTLVSLRPLLLKAIMPWVKISVWLSEHHQCRFVKVVSSNLLFSPFERIAALQKRLPYSSILLAKHIILDLSLCCWWCPLHVPNEYSANNLSQFIHRDIIYRTSLIWNNHNLCHLFFVAWLTVPAFYGASTIFAIHSSDHTSLIRRNHNLYL